MTPIRLTGPRVTLRSTTPDDVAILTPIRNEPEVLRWWSHLAAGEMDEFVADEHSLAIEVDGYHILSLGNANVTPWNCPRDVTEDVLAAKIDEAFQGP